MEVTKSKQFQKCPHCGQMVVYKTDYCRLCRKHHETGVAGTPEQVAGPDAPPPPEEVEYKGDAQTLGIWCLLVGVAWLMLGLRSWHGGFSLKLFTGVSLMGCATGLLAKWSPRHVCYVILGLLMIEAGVCVKILLLPISMVMSRGFDLFILYLAALPASALLVYLNLGMKVLVVLDDYKRIEWRKYRFKPEVIDMRDTKQSQDKKTLD